MSLVGNDTESDTESGGQKLFRHSGWKGRTGSMNKRGRKFLSVSLAAMMTLNMLPVGTIYAEETVTEASSESKETQAESKKPETEATKPETEATKAETASTEAATQLETPKAEETKTPETAGETATTEETTATESASETTDSEQTETTAPDSETAASKAEKETAGEHTKTEAEKKAEQPKIVKTELEEKDGKTYVRVYTDSKTYDRLYVGKKDDADKAPVIEGRKEENGCYSFAFPADETKYGQMITVVPGVKEENSWYTDADVYVQMPVKNETLPEAPAEEQTEAAGETLPDENTASGENGNAVELAAEENQSETEAKNKMEVIYSKDNKESQYCKPGDAYSMFVINKYTAKRNGDKIDITIYVNSKPKTSTLQFTYDAIYIGTAQEVKDNKIDATKIINGTIEGNLQKYTFSVSSELEGKEIEIVPKRFGKDASNGRSYYTSNKLALKMPEELIFETESESETKATEQESETQAGSTEKPDKELKDAKISIAYGGSGATVIGFKVLSSSAKLIGNKVSVTFTVDGTIYDRIYLGNQKDTNKTAILGKQEDGKTTFTFEVDAQKQGYYLLITPGSADGTWLKNEARDLYISIPNLNKDTDAAQYKDGIYDLYGRTYTEGEFLPVEKDSKITIQGDKIIVTINTNSGTRIDKIYLGNVEDSDSQKDANAIEGNLYGNNYRVYSFAISRSQLGKNISIVLHNPKTNTWSTKTTSLCLPEILEKTGDVTPEETKPTEKPDQTEETNQTEKPEQPSGPSNGIYNTTATTGAAMFKVQDVELTVKNGKMTALITLTGTGYDYLFMGTGAQAAAAGEGQWIKYKDEVKYTQDGETKAGRRYEIPVSALDTPLAVASYSHKNTKWYDRTITISSKNLKKTAELPAENAPANGIYSTTVTTGAAMFKVVNAQLTVKNGQIQALITLSGTGYDYLYVGTGAQASAAGQGQWVKWQDEVTYTDAGGAQKTGRRYMIPVSALGEPIAIASHSESHNKWYDRTITFSSADLKKVGELPADDTQDSNNGGGETETETNNTTNTTTKPKPDKKPDKESKYESDLSGSTGAVNNSTGLADGVYTPDSFSFSGGSGRISISCTKITVTGGKALATIVFNSSYYGYVKANGNKYFPTHSGNTSIFTIPVNLNANTTIIGMTTRMSAAHEITYTIYVGLNAAKNTDGKGTEAGNESGNKKLDEQAPDISGLTYQSETKLDYAKYFKLYHYDQDITLLEVDMTQAEKAADGTKAVYAESESETETEAATATAAAAATEDGEAVVQTQGEKVSELYQADVVKYLIIPADSTAELPAGIEKEMILVHQPLESAYVSGDTALATLDELGLLDAVKTVGVEQDTTTVEAVKSGLADGSMTYAGGADDLQYRELVKSKCDFAVLPADILSGDEMADTDVKSKLSDAADSFATLDVPMLVDRSADEETELGKREWIKVYGALFGCTEQTDSLFQKAVDAAK